MEKTGQIKKLWEAWKKFARIIGVVNTKIILSAFYFVFIGLYALLRRLALIAKLKKRPATFWRKREKEFLTLEECEYQF